MPYRSNRQRKFFYANRKRLAERGVNVSEWDKKSIGTAGTKKKKKRGHL